MGYTFDANGGQRWDGIMGPTSTSGSATPSGQTTTNGVPSAQLVYQQNQAAYVAQQAQEAAAAKTAALQKAWQANQQALNSQNATVQNNYQSSANKLNSLQQARLPEYQQQRDSASAEGAAQLRRTQAINALGGKYFSGANRSQMLNVDLAKQNAINGYTQGENQFKTDIGNQLSEADANRVAALNDIASKLSLGQQQLAQGTLDVNNQLASDVATGSMKAFMDAQAWADTQQQQGIDNSARQAQLDQAAKLAELQQAFQNKQFDASQSSEAFNQALQQGQLLGSYNGQQTLAAQAQSAEQAYKQEALKAEQQNQALNRAASAAKASTPKSPSVTELNYQDKQNSQQATADAMAKLQEKANQGWTRDEVLNWMYSNSQSFMGAGVDMDNLAKLASSAYQWNSDTESRYK